jgi:hypothetical protein
VAEVEDEVQKVEDKVQNIENEHHYRDFDSQVLCGPEALGGTGGSEVGRYRERDSYDGEHRRVCPRDSHRESLGAVLEAPNQKARTQHQQHVPDNRADYRGLNDGCQSGYQGEYGDDELGGVAEGGIEYAADARARVMPKAFGGLPEDPSEAYKGEGG